MQTNFTKKMKSLKLAATIVLIWIICIPTKAINPISYNASQKDDIKKEYSSNYIGTKIWFKKGIRALSSFFFEERNEDRIKKLSNLSIRIGVLAFLVLASVPLLGLVSSTIAFLIGIIGFLAARSLMLSTAKDKEKYRWERIKASIAGILGVSASVWAVIIGIPLINRILDLFF